MIEYNKEQYPTRIVDVPGVGYVQVAPERLLRAIQPKDDIHYEWVESSIEATIDEMLAGYVEDDIWDKNLSNEELGKWIKNNLYN